MSTRWEIDEYVEDDGRTPIRDFVAGLEPAERGRLSTRLEYVREEGLRAGAHVLKNLRAGRGDARGKLWELRLENSPNNPRVLSFATAGRTLVLLHGFRKTGRPDDKIPEREVRIALRRMRRYLERRGTP